MIIVQLSGGLGNQLFQYAFGRALSLKHNQMLAFNVDSFKWDKLRKFELDSLYLDLKIVNSDKIKKTIKNKFLISDKILYFFLNKKIPYYKSAFIKERSLLYDKNHIKFRVKNVYFEGYWQSENYFTDFKDLINSELRNFKLLNSSSLKLLSELNLKKNTVSIHFRRSDYILDKKTNAYHGICSNDYYQKAIKLIQNKIENPHFFIFSDDKKYINEVFKDKTNFTIVENITKDYEELLIMSACEHHIIANSSFSWWGAWLNPSKNKIVIAPQKWFSDKEMQLQTDNLIPESWIKI
jgi:hypothetical protein